MVALRRISVFLLSVTLSAYVIHPVLAQEADPAPIAAKHKKAKRSRHEAKSEPAKAQEPAPWAAVDPGRAMGATPAADPNAAATPGVQHIVQPDEDRLSYGMKWNSSNAPNAGAASTQGVINEVNHNLGAPNAVGTDAEMGVKLHF